MKRNTRKFIWNWFWAVVFGVIATMIGASADSISDWIFFGVGVVIFTLFWKGAEETFKED